MYVSMHVEERETEIEISLDCWTVEKLARCTDELRRLYGPDRDVGPIRFLIRGGEPLQVAIGTQKQGDYVFVEGEHGLLMQTEGSYPLDEPMSPATTAIPPD